MHIPSILAEIRGAVFDFDGTIMDSMPDWAGKMLNLLDTHHVVYPADIIRTITPLGDGGSARYFIDKLGLDMLDRRMLTAVVQQFRGGPVGLETLAAMIGEEAVTIEDVYEPYLMQIGFLIRTQRGRCVTEAACRHLGLEFPK